MIRLASRVPVFASSAWIVSPKFHMNMMPSCTSGVNSLTAPLAEARPHVHATFRSFTLLRLICVSGLLRPAVVRAAPVEPVARRRIAQHLVRHRRQTIKGCAHGRELGLGKRRKRTATAAAAPWRYACRGRSACRGCSACRRRLGSRLRQDDTVQERPPANTAIHAPTERANFSTNDLDKRIGASPRNLPQMRGTGNAIIPRARLKDGVVTGAG